MNGYIKVHRGMLDWEWYADANTKSVFLHLLLTARHNTGSYRGYPLNPGDVVIGRTALADALNMSVRSVRTSLDHLVNTQEVTIKSTNKFSIVTLVNWEKYQSADLDTDQQTDKRLTNERPSIDQQPTNDRQTTDHNGRKKEREKERREEGKKREGRFAPPSVDEVSAYCAQRGNGIDAQTFVDFYTGKGWMIGKNKMKDWKASVRTWEQKRDGGRQTQGQAKGYSNPFVDLARQYEEAGV